MGYQAVQLVNRRKHRSLAEELVSEYTKRIRDGGIQCGEKLPTELQIMEEQNLSRTVVREAISRLQAAGLVETRHGIGTFVLDTPSTSGFRIDPATILNLHDVMALLELRISLEVESASLACLRRTDEDLRSMREALDAPGANAADASDFKFHLLIAMATGNSYFIDIVQHLGASIISRMPKRSARWADDTLQKNSNRLKSDNEAIFQAISRQDCESARAAMRLHLLNSRESLRDEYETAERSLFHQ